MKNSPKGEFFSKIKVMAFKYQILSHPADIKLQITASTKEELFQGALAGMASIIQPQMSRKAPIAKENIEVQSLDFNTLLVDFLSEVLAKTDISHAVFHKLKIKKLTDNFLQTEIEGQKSDYFSQEIKAVTHYDLEIKQDKSGNYQVTILFDI